MNVTTDYDARFPTGSVVHIPPSSCTCLLKNKPANLIDRRFCPDDMHASLVVAEAEDPRVSVVLLSELSRSRLPCELLVHTSRSLTGVLLSYLIYMCSGY